MMPRRLRPFHVAFQKKNKENNKSVFAILSFFHFLRLRAPSKSPSSFLLFFLFPWKNFISSSTIPQFLFTFFTISILNPFTAWAWGSLFPYDFSSPYFLYPSLFFSVSKWLRTILLPALISPIPFLNIAHVITSLPSSLLTHLAILPQKQKNPSPLLSISEENGSWFVPFLPMALLATSILNLHLPREGVLGIL